MLRGERKNSPNSRKAFIHAAFYPAPGTTQVRSLAFGVQSKPKILILAGPNGAGKTTFAREYVRKVLGFSRFVNADLIAPQGYPPLIRL